MTDFYLTLRTPGTRLLLHRLYAQPLVDRAFEERPDRRPGTGLLRALFTGQARRAEREEEADREAPRTLALPNIRWAETVEEGEGYAIVDGIAVIDIRGVLTPEGYYDWWADTWTGGYAQIGAALDAARADGRVRAIFLRVDSPGGLVDGCFDLADQIRNGRKAAGGKPAWVHANMACSAAYALACGADRITANAEAEVGSIGVLILHLDMSEMLKEWGLKVEAIASGARKTIGAPWKPLPKEDREHFQAIVDQLARRFIAVVTAGRPALSEDAIRAQEALWYLAAHDEPERSGLALGLIDEIANERAAFAALKQSLSQQSGSGAPEATGDPSGAASQETTMSKKLADEVAALETKAAAGDEDAKKRLAAINKAMAPAAESEEDDDEKDKDEEAAAEDKDEEAESEEKDEEAESDDDKEPDANAKGTTAGFALLTAPEAKGRDAMARELAAAVASKQLTYGAAKKILAAAPKASKLSERMAGRDQNPGADSGASSKPGEGLSAAIDRLNTANAKRH